MGKVKSKKTREKEKEQISQALKQIKDTAHSYLELVDDNFIDMALATVISMKFDSDPLWLFLKAPPSSAKTEILRAFDGHSSVMFLSSFTKSTLLSGYIKGEDTKVDVSLLNDLKGKVMVLKDFTTVLQLRSEERSEIFAQLREIYDGMYDKAFGTGERKKWRGKMGFLAGVTPEIERQTSVNQTLGERFLYYSIPVPDPLIVAERAMSNTTGEKERREQLRKAVHFYLDLFNSSKSLPDVLIDDGIEEKLKKLAIFCATGRTTIIRDRFTKNIEVIPSVEGPARLVKQFMLLGASLATVRGIDHVDDLIYDIIKKVARDCLPSLRMSVIETVYGLFCENPEKWWTTKEIASNINMPSTTVKYQLEEIQLLELAEQETLGNGYTAAQQWKASESLIDMIMTSEIFA